MNDYVSEIRKRIGTYPLLLIGSNVIVVNSSGQILLQLRSDTNDWGLPGGFMEPGETIEETAKRELQEETGLLAESLELFGIYSGPDFFVVYPNGDQAHNVSIVYLATKIVGDLKTDSNEVVALRYFDMSNIPQELFSGDAQIIKSYASYSTSHYS